mgnify:CR=1 FL=1
MTVLVYKRGIKNETLDISLTSFSIFLLFFMNIINDGFSVFVWALVSKPSCVFPDAALVRETVGQPRP